MLKYLIVFIVVGPIFLGCVPMKTTTRTAGPPTAVPTELQTASKSVQEGMQVNDVKALKGEPDILKDQGQRDYVFYYWDGKGHVPVTFKGGKVVDVGYGKFSHTIIPSAEKMVETDANKEKNGAK
jgi:hypothetical protein